MRITVTFSIIHFSHRRRAVFLQKQRESTATENVRLLWRTGDIAGQRPAMSEELPSESALLDQDAFVRRLFHQFNQFDATRNGCGRRGACGER